MDIITCSLCPRSGGRDILTCPGGQHSGRPFTGVESRSGEQGWVLGDTGPPTSHANVHVAANETTAR